MEKRGIIDREHTPPEIEGEKSKAPNKLAEHLTKRAADQVAATADQIVKSSARQR